MKKLIFALMPLFLFGCASVDEASVGIIGGADGPTAVFVASSVLNPALIAVSILTVAMIIGAVIAVIFIHKRK